jgi:ubiquitin carboxyl-terminal hydrolase 4/11/15
MEIYRCPKILIINLKRFKTSKVSSIGNFHFPSGGHKIGTFVEYPLKDLDLKNYIKNTSDNVNTTYDLFAVSNHYGGMGGGHYTAYAKNWMLD